MITCLSDFDRDRDPDPDRNPDSERRSSAARSGSSTLDRTRGAQGAPRYHTHTHHEVRRRTYGIRRVCAPHDAGVHLWPRLGTAGGPFKVEHGDYTVGDVSQLSKPHAHKEEAWPTHTPLTRSSDHAIAHIWHVQPVLALLQAVLGARDALVDILDLARRERGTLPRTFKGRHRLRQGRAQGWNASLAWQPHGSGVRGWGTASGGGVSGTRRSRGLEPARYVPAVVSSS